MPIRLTPCFKRPLYLLRTSFIVWPPFFPLALALSEHGFSFWQGAVMMFAFYSLLFGALLAFIAGIYRGTTFEIGETAASYRLNFLWSRNKDILFLNVKEIELKSGIFQRFFNLGSLVIHTQATTTGNNRAGIVFFDVENPQKAYELLKDRVYKAQHPSRK